ncbi:hypothetical protein L6164_013759 [Bauhinia variegata]|uniref:Uncharacterized protein n=1 Tax=Bauhinia variegata TaxID=167791 RepID=A0ACB9NFD3_BAUVA|nr:hypothetical protein L6164_013759 [Bauhinia variegata]
MLVAFPIPGFWLKNRAAMAARELPIRLARRAIELENLPYGLSQKPAILKVRDWYLDSFRDLRSFPEIKDMNDEKEFTEMIKAIKVRHNNVVQRLGAKIFLRFISSLIAFTCQELESACLLTREVGFQEVVFQEFLHTLYSTAKDDVDLEAADNVIMAGYGYGLPISPLYARYFGGDLQLISMEGYGQSN